MKFNGVPPPPIREALIRASKVDISVDPNARTKAINRVIERARASHPELFRDEDIDDDAPAPERERPARG